MLKYSKASFRKGCNFLKGIEINIMAGYDGYIYEAKWTNCVVRKISMRILQRSMQRSTGIITTVKNPSRS